MKKTPQSVPSGRLAALVLSLVLPIAPASAVDVYVSPNGSDGADGSASAPYKTIGQAVTALGGAGGTVHVMPGAYPITTTTENSTQVTLSAPVRIVGVSGDPRDVVVYRLDPVSPNQLTSPGYYDNNAAKYRARVFTLDHADALLRYVTVSNGLLRGNANTQYGANVWIKQGTVADCIVTTGINSWYKDATKANYSLGDNVHLSGASARMARCIVENGAFAWRADSQGTWTQGGQIYATAGVVESTLVRKGGHSGGVLLAGTARAVNCTIVDNRGASVGGLQIDSGASAYNCAVYGNLDQGGNAADIGGAGVASGLHASAVGAFVSVTGDAVSITSAAFTDYAGGDYTPAPDGALMDAGTDYAAAGGTSSSDLAGSTRIAGSAPDIGAYELDASAAEIDPALSVVRNADGTYSLSAGVSGTGTYTATLYLNGTAVPGGTISGAAPGYAFAQTIPADYAPGTYAAELAVASQSGTETRSAAPSAFLVGSVSVAGGTDADEDGLVPGTFVLTRSAGGGALSVAYEVTSPLAVAGQSYVAPSGTATFAAGETTCTVSVVPRGDSAVAEDTTLSLSILPGLYGIDGAASSATIALLNKGYPPDKNVWIASAAGLASNPDNWSQGRVPTPADDILLDSDFSSADMEWDGGVNGLTDTVASWTQTATYTGTVTFDTVYPGHGAFTAFAIAGDASVVGGTWTHPQSLSSGAVLSIEQLKAQETYRLNVAVGGDLTLGAGASVNAAGKGMEIVANVNVPVFPAHGGWHSGTLPSGYGNPKAPEDIGYAAAQGGSDQDWKRSAGGGAIHLAVAGTATLDGVVSADGGLAGVSGGAAGSVWVEAAAIAGSGTVTASGGVCSDTNYGGVGGRIALVASGTLDASSLTLLATAPHRSSGGGAGTVFTKSGSQTYGALVVDNGGSGGNNRINGNRTPVTDEGDWTFDAVSLGGQVQLIAPEGTTLRLPGGLASVTALANANNTATRLGTLGGTLDFGETASQTLRGNIQFTAYPAHPLVFPHSLTLADGAVLGLSSWPTLHDTIAAYRAARPPAEISIGGDLAVGAGCAVSANWSGSRVTTLSDGWSWASHGGSKGDSLLASYAYGSILHPQFGGINHSGGGNLFFGGGAIRLAVAGDLVVDGDIVSNGYNNGGNDTYAGAGGSLDVTAATLSGTGLIRADSGRATAGGRVAVRLTAPGATFGDFGLDRIRAAKTSSTAAVAPGTVYLQTGDQAEGAGTIRVSGLGAGATIAEINSASTPIPANGAEADAPAALAKCSLDVVSYGHASLPCDLRLDTVSVDATSRITLDGHVLTVRKARVGGTVIGIGTYASDRLPDGFADGSAGETGALVVLGDTTILVFR